MIMAMTVGINGEKIFIMKQKSLLGLFATALLLWGCADDDFTGKVVDNPAQSGDEIIFGSTLANNASEDLKTTYGSRTGTGVPVYWRTEGDTVAIFCLQASQPSNHLVRYIVKPQEGDQTASASVTKVNTEEAGLQWGEGDGSLGEHRFYAFYPSSAVKGTTEEDYTGQITANIPVNQMVSRWRRSDNPSDNVAGIDGKVTIFGEPNMHYAYMYAHSAVAKDTMNIGDPISLEFKNLVTVLDITVQGPEDVESITLSNINITATDGENNILTGDFVCNIREAEDNSNEVTADCTPAGNLQAIRNRISISCYDRDNDKFIELKRGEMLNVKAYIIPDNLSNVESRPRQFEITVNTMNGAPKVKKLTSPLTPFKVNRVLLPPLQGGGSNYWMDDLDPNIYITELSWPGSKMSMLTSDNRASIVYQSTTISKQFEDGVRAFIVHAMLSGGNLYASADNNRVKQLTDVFKDIANKLAECENAGKRESAFVLVTYSGNSSGWNEDRHQRDWFRTLQSTINSMANDQQYRIFNGTLSPETTLADVANKIIVKCNYNSDNMISEAGNAPMLYTLWTQPYVPRGLPMWWSTPSGANSFTWLYQEVTSVLDNENNKCGGGDFSCEATDTQKEEYIKEIFQKSVDAYKNDDTHSTWFMNDLGGYYGYCSNPNSFLGAHIHDEVRDVAGLTTDMNSLGVQLLQERTENAGLGLVFMNFANRNADGQQYQSDWLIQTIIDNNFKFELRKKGGSSEYQNYNASYSDMGNAIGWDE